MCMMGKLLLICLTCVLVCSALAAVLLGIASGLLNFLFQKVLEKEISKQLTLEEGHASYEQLQEPTVPTYKSIYFFNLTNPEAFEQGNATAVLQEIGPYTYRERRLKYFSDGENKDELSYTQTQYYYFDRNSSGSGLRESDTICTINIPLMVGVYTVLENPEFIDVLKYLLNATSSQLYTCQNVSGLIWGYTDRFLQALYDMGLSPTQKSWLMVNGSSTTDSSPDTIYTGVSDISQIAKYLQWNGHTHHLDIWMSEQANLIRGTEGIFFKPNLKQGDELAIFIGDLQRSFDLQNTAMVDHMGMSTLRYQFPQVTFKGAFTEPQNAQWGSWCPDGLFNMGPVREPELPIYGSKPHFLDGDKSLLQGVKGLEPSREKHDSHIDVEPTIGANVDFSVQFQLNVRVNTSANFSFLENLQGVDSNGSLFFPVVYINQHAEFSEELKEYLDESGLNNVRHLESLVVMLFYILGMFLHKYHNGVGLAGASALLTLASGVAMLWAVLKLKQSRHDDEVKPLLDPDLPTAIVHQYYARKNSAKDE